MEHPHIWSLYSGSTGNAFLIRAGEVQFLIDAGKSARSLTGALAACGTSPDRLCAIFLTHEHEDHTKALPIFLKKYPLPVHLPQSCTERLAQEETLAPLLCPHPPVHTETLGGGVTVTSFPTPHDSRGSVGYRIAIPTDDGIFQIGFATDIGYVSAAVKEGLTGCQAVILESNHDPEMLETGPYPYQLKKRIASRRGHLSNPDCACFAAQLCGTGTRSLMLAHLSETNNTPDCAFDEMAMTLADESVRICIAGPREVVEMDLGGCFSC